MKKLGMCVLAGLLAVMLAAPALASGIPGLEALLQVAAASKPAEVKLPDVFEITYRTADGEVSLSRDADGNLTARNGDETLLYLKVDEDAYLPAVPGDTGYTLTATETVTLDGVKEALAFVWDMIEPREEHEATAVVAIFDGNVDLIGRSANRFRQALHESDANGYSVKTTAAVWYTFDKETGACLMKETGPDENRSNATIAYECISFK